MPVEDRITNLLQNMTLEEKIACLGTVPSVTRLGIVGAGHVEGLHGLAMGGPGGWGRPSIVPTTQFPQAMGLGETWDPELLRKAAALEGYETRYMFQSPVYHRGGLVVRAPNADLARDIRWGRTEESYGEDAFFNGTMVAAFVRGLQGDDPHYWQAASLMKHFLANSNEDTRSSSSSNFDERLFREYYSVPFRRGIEEGGSRAFMASYNAVNGTPMEINPILKQIAVGEWHNDGIMCTDGGAMTLLVTAHKRFATLPVAAAASVKAGINQFLDKYDGPTHAAVASGLLSESDIDASLRGVFRVMIKLGQLDPPSMVPYTKIKNGPDPWTLDSHKQLAREVTQKSIVLLKNSEHTLPLDRKRIHSIAVIGPYADQVLLDWYSGTPPYSVSPLQGIRNKVGEGVRVEFARNNDRGKAVQIARASDVAIVVVGNHPECDAGWAKCPVPSNGKEAVDRRSIELEQEALVRQVYAAKPQTIMVLSSSFPYALKWSQENIPAILHMTHNSQELGNALADALFGDINPGGHLAHTWPRSESQLPPLMDYDIRHGRTYMYFRGEPLYPFGYGLSYTDFRISDLKVNGAMRPGASIMASVKVRNTGHLAGDEVVQIYATYPHSKVSRPEKQLVGFQRVTLAAGAERVVQIPIESLSIAYWDTDKHAFVTEGPDVVLHVGDSSAHWTDQVTVKVETGTAPEPHELVSGF